MKRRVAGKVAIVTGAAGMIGGASARAFAREGARVVVSDVADERGSAVAEEIVAAGGEAVYVHCDVTVPAEVDKLVRRTVEAYGRVDVLHTNPFFHGGGAVADLTDEAWHRAMAVTLDGVFSCSRAVIPEMLRVGGGSIVHTSSVNGVVISMDNSPAYAAAKGGVIQLSRSIARDYARRGIRCNALCPGDVKPKAIADNPPANGIVWWQSALGRSAYPEEIAEVAVFLASDAASYVTGAAIMADCGWTAS